ATDHDLVPQERSDAPLDDVAVFVFMNVAVERRGQRTRRHRVLDQGEPSAGLGSVKHEPDPDAAQEPGLAVARTDDLRCGRVHRFSFHRTVVSRRIYTTSHRPVNIQRTAMTDRKRPYRKGRRAELE